MAFKTHQKVLKQIDIIDIISVYPFWLSIINKMIQAIDIIWLIFPIATKSYQNILKLYAIHAMKIRPLLYISLYIFYDFENLSGVFMTKYSDISKVYLHVSNDL